MNISSKYTIEKTDTGKEAAILIRCYGPNEKTKIKLITDLGMTESEAQQIINEHASAMASQSKSYFRDRTLLVLCGLMLGLIGGLFLFVSAP